MVATTQDAPPDAAQAHAQSTFDPRRFVTRVGGADYLEVKWRVYWLRTQHPDATIDVQHIDIDMERGHAVFRSTVSIPGAGSATDYGSESISDFKDFIEKAATKATGRALAALGFGTQFTPDFDFADGRDKVVDAPVRMARQRQVSDLADQRSAERRTESAKGYNERQGITDRQMSFIRQMARERNLTDQAADAQVMERYGKRLDQLDRRDASAYIEHLKSVAPSAQHQSEMSGVPQGEPGDDHHTF